ncbi:MAG: PilZ domain-containing protein [Geobacteraceae bacterium]|nr:PilZ domain-containing protein [Geobacteraceae bacterium]
MRQRRFPRIQLDSKAFIKTANKSFSADAVNLSIHGTFIKTHEHIASGTPVEVDIKVPCASHSPFLLINGVVARVENSGIVIEFTRMDPDVFQCLNNVVQRRSTHRLKPYMAP